MTCPHCLSTSISKRQHRTSLGYQTFSCRACRLRFNQRTGSPFNDLQFPTDVVLLAVLCVCATSSDFAKSPSSCCSVASKSVTRPSATGSSALHPWLVSGYGPNVAATPAVPGISTKPTSKSAAAGLPLQGDRSRRQPPRLDAQ